MVGLGHPSNAANQNNQGDGPPRDDKRFPCTYPGCSKRFTRAEHMHRHALNHTPGEHTCLECRAHFKRPDLLRKYHRIYQDAGAQQGRGCPG